MNQIAPTNSWLNATGNRNTRAHQKAKIVVAIKRLRRLNRKDIPGSSVREPASRGGGGGVGAGESVLIVELAIASERYNRLSFYQSKAESTNQRPSVRSGNGNGLLAIVHGLGPCPVQHALGVVIWLHAASTDQQFQLNLFAT